jgi:hypothetical protein
MESADVDAESTELAGVSEGTIMESTDESFEIEIEKSKAKKPKRKKKYRRRSVGRRHAGWV